MPKNLGSCQAAFFLQPYWSLDESNLVKCAAGQQCSKASKSERTRHALAPFYYITRNAERRCPPLGVLLVSERAKLARPSVARLPNKKGEMGENSHKRKVDAQVYRCNRWPNAGQWALTARSRAICLSQILKGGGGGCVLKLRSAVSK